ncbi:MAG: hypothetical protein ACK4UO_07465 [Pseudolabrys sp.]
MKTAIRAGAIALAITAFVPHANVAIAANAGVALSEAAASIDVGRIKSVLKLTAEQERHWPPVEAALRDIARRQVQNDDAGLVRRVSRRIVSVVLDSAAIQRLAVVARPLIASLDAQQLSAASSLASEMGLGPVVAALR